MSLIKDETLVAVKNQIALRNDRLRDFAALYAETTWAQIQLDVKTLSAEALATKYPVGTELICKYTLGDTEYDFPWVVLDNNRECVWEDGTTHPGLWLGAKYNTIEDIQFDAPEGIETDDTTAEEGYYYCGISGSTYTMLNLSAGDPVPLSSYTKVLKGVINNAGAYQYGYNRYRDSAQRQWINSAEAAGDWWESTHYGDNAPSQLATRAGFLAGLDSDFVAVITPAKVSVATNTVTDGGVTDVMYDKFFIQSIEEMYGSPQAAGVEGTYFPYWKTVTGLDSPSNNANDGRKRSRIDTPTGAAVGSRLRSSFRRGVYGVWSCSASGQLGSGSSASGSYAALPACVIS